MCFGRNRRRGHSAIGRIMSVLTGCWAANACMAAAPWGFSLANIVSEGRMVPHPSSANNGVAVVSYSGNGFQVGTVRLEGDVSPSSPPSGSPPADLRVRIEKLSPQGFVLEWWNSGQLHAQTTPIQGVVHVGPVQFNAASLGWIAPGQSVRVRCYETYDADAGPVPVIDALWQELVVTFGPLAPPGPDLAMLISDDDDVIDTIGSDYVAAIGLYAPDGTLLATGETDPTGASYISLDGLPPGEYHLCCAGAGASFDDNFEVAPGAAGGALVVNYPGGSVETQTHADSIRWYRLVPPSGPARVIPRRP